MRRLSHPANPLYQPLDAVLGTPAAVRILRVLGRHGGVLAPTTIAKRARINRAGAGRTLARLVTADVVEVVGQGRYVSYRLNQAHPFARELVVLFKRESERVDGLFELIREVTEGMRPSPTAVWLLDSGKEGELVARVEFAIVAPRSTIVEQAGLLRQALVEFGGKWAMEVSLLEVTPEDLRRWMSTRDPFWEELESNAFPLYGGTLRQVVLEL